MKRKYNMTRREFSEWFFSNVDKLDNGCWIWRGARTRSGYAQVWYNGRMQRAARVSFVLANTSIPDGTEVCHTCDVRMCVNPSHLTADTHQANMQDAVAKGRICGERNSRAKLTWAQVRDIRTHYGDGATMEQLASVYDMHKATIQGIISHRTWKEPYERRRANDT